MVDTARIWFPDDLTQTARVPDVSSLEGFANNTIERVKQYARDEPVSFAMWTFGIGFVLGWRLKPW